MTFVEQQPESLLVIDELRRPRTRAGLQQAVDRDRRSGDSSSPAQPTCSASPAVQDSLTDRPVGVELHGFSEGELHGHVEQFIDRASAGDGFLGHQSTRTKADYLKAITLKAGRKPRPLVRRPPRSDRQAGRRRHRRPAARLRMIAPRNADKLNIANGSTIPATTLNPSHPSARHDGLRDYPDTH